ncbi:MAG: ABC transporter ATP-binding protein [Chloroherpetonaceae bacterium]|nr:ABC transporter ATP-binding protein [Chloroherpetonaceae bacterium]
MKNTAISVSSLSKKYQLGATHSTSIRGWYDSVFSKEKAKKPETEFWALKDVSFDINKGDSVGIIGKNGAGKSTLLKILSRITEPTSGEIVINGRVASLLEVGTGFHSELTGRENIFLNGTILGMKKAEIKKKFEEIVDFSGIEKFIDTPVKRYSSGMYVRLAFAVAAHLEPEILIVDEVLAVGDAEFQKKCLGKMGEVTEKEGRTVLFVSHNLSSITKLCKKSILMDKGTVESFGSSTEIVHKYLSLYDTIDNRSYIEFKENGELPLSIRSIKIFSNNIETNNIYYGDDIELKIEFISRLGIKSPKIGYVIYNESGDPICCSNNRFIPSEDYQFPVNKGVIVLKLNAINLIEGKYSLSFWFGDNVQDYDILQNVLYLNIIPKDIWGSGYLPPRLSNFWISTEYSLK